MHPRAMSRPLGLMFGSLESIWKVLLVSWGGLGASWGTLGGSWDDLGGILGAHQRAFKFRPAAEAWLPPGTLPPVSTIEFE